VNAAYFADWLARALALASYSAGLGGALGVGFVMVFWCALRPGTATVVGTGLVALAGIGVGAHGALCAGQWVLGGSALFWGAVFVAFSLRGARTLEPAFFVARASAPPPRASAAGGPYRSHAALPRPSAARPSALWSRSLIGLYASAVVAALLVARLAS
jgi:hypothetical protein